MKKILLSSVALVALFAAAPASAADVPVRGPIYKATPAPIFNWTGFYVGGHVGYGFGESGPIAGPDPEGFFGGLQLGYNWQFAPNWVFGLETDISGSDLNDSVAGVNSHIDYFGTTRARLGYTWDRTMLYVTGGLAYGEASMNGFHNNHFGYTVGAGLEWAFAPNWSAKVEYLYVDLGSENYPTVIPTNVDFNIHTVKLGVNYRFGTYGY